MATIDEPVDALQHALQCAHLAEREGAPAPLVVAALLHDVGHFVALDAVGGDAIDDVHELRALGLLACDFGRAVLEPIRLHVQAKRLLVASDADYAHALTPASALWVAGTVGVDVLDRSGGMPLAHIDVRHLGAVNSVAIHRGVAALAIENTLDRTLPGVVVFHDTRSRLQLGAPVTVGALPDMVTFTPDGRELLVANEATPNPRPTPAGLSADDPVGSVSIIDVRTRRVTTLPIDPSIPGYDTLRLFPASGSLPTQPATYSPYGPEPEYIAIDKTGRYAYVTLQEANGVAVLDLRQHRFERIFNLGLKPVSSRSCRRRPW